MTTTFRYNTSDLIVETSRLITKNSNEILTLLATPINGEIRWFSTIAIEQILGIWRASINRILARYEALGWVETVYLDNIPSVDSGAKQTRRRKLWQLIDDRIGFEIIFNEKAGLEMFDLGSLGMDLEGVDDTVKFTFSNQNIFHTIQEIGSESVLNFIAAFDGTELYYQDVVDELRNNSKAAPKHEKLSKLCDIKFQKMGIDLEMFKILDRKFTPDKSTGAPGYTYYLNYSGIRFLLRSTEQELDVEFYRPKADDWQLHSVTASQISALREGIVIGKSSIEPSPTEPQSESY